MRKNGMGIIKKGAKAEWAILRNPSHSPYKSQFPTKSKLLVIGIVVVVVDVVIEKPADYYYYYCMLIGP